MAGNLALHDKVFTYNDAYDLDNSLVLFNAKLKRDVGNYKKGHEFQLVFLSYEASVVWFCEHAERHTIDLHVHDEGAEV